MAWWRSILAGAALAVTSLSPSAAVAQTSGAAEGYHQKGRAAYDSRPPDYVNAAASYRRAAELGYHPAENDLGWLYQNGWGVPRDLRQAVYWYRLAATGGYATAQVNLGWMYQKALGVPRDYREAMRWYRLAAAQQNAFASDNLGVLYRDGLGVPRDDAEAVAWFRKSAAAGHASGQTNLGWMYHNGWAVPRDYVEAAKWYRLAANQGDALAQNNLGVVYRDGLGVPRDLDQAVAWFRKAAAGGDPRAQQSLQHLQSRQRGMDPWANVLAGKQVMVALSQRGFVYLFVKVPVQLSGGHSIDVEIPVKIFTDPELRDLGVLGPDGSITITGNPKIPYKPMRAASEAQKRRFLDEFATSAISIHWPPYVVVAPGLDKEPGGSKDVVRAAIERLYER